MLSSNYLFCVHVEMEYRKKYRRIADSTTLQRQFFMGFQEFYEVARLWASSPSVGYLTIGTQYETFPS